jgi:hypothetical protein
MATSGLGVVPQASTASGSCQVLSGISGYAVQGALFTVCVSSLLLKWYLEAPRRKLRIFVLDSSKQFIGAGVIHCLNLVSAVAFTRFENSPADECAWYWINIVIDTTFGVAVCWILLKATERIFGYTSGDYGEASVIDWEANPDVHRWSLQIGVWCVIVSLMKIMVVCIMYSFAPIWERVSVTCTHWIPEETRRLIFVMIVTPTMMNMFQFWVTDSFLKFTTKAKKEGVAANRAADETTALRSA